MSKHIIGLGILVAIIAIGLYLKIQSESKLHDDLKGTLSMGLLPLDESNATESKAAEASRSFYRYLFDSGKYTIVDSKKTAAMLKLKGLSVDDVLGDKRKIKKLGTLLGVDKLVYSKLDIDSTEEITMTVRVYDVFSGKTELTKEEHYSGYSPDDHAKFCASDIMQKYPLIGLVTGKSGDGYFIDLGSGNGLKKGDRIFSAKRTIIRNDSGEAMFYEYKRAGILRISHINNNFALIKPEKPAGLSLEKGDVVSPEPIPVTAPEVSKTPLLAHIKKGSLLLDDDMKTKKYFGENPKNGILYSNGKLYLDARNKETGHTYVFYPAPFDGLQDFILEGEVEFLPTSSKYNKVCVVFRSNAGYSEENSYELFWNNSGEGGIYQNKLGTIFDVVPLQSNPAINTGTGRNKFRIVAFGSRFDWYMNDVFIAGFEDESLEKGTIGFFANARSYDAISAVKIWDVSTN